ncbi:MAG: hypothetical protein DCF22_24430 [Leptolyngbya sp.]|nr:MAG: hypothetical protein DCF22_24430 [Leptolyngbya sp.]
MGQTQIVQSAGGFHHIIRIIGGSVAKCMHHNVATFDATDLMFYFDSFARYLPVVLFLGITYSDS